MITICPSVLAKSPSEYKDILDKVAHNSHRIQIDLMDGVFASPRSINIEQVYWPDNVMADIHLMYLNPLVHLETLIAIKPNLVIVHAEAEAKQVEEIITALSQDLGIKIGIALLPKTDPAEAIFSSWIKKADHCLIFAGHLGQYGGEADMTQTSKIKQIKSINPDIEIGWDGGVNDKNIRELINSGIDVINVGGFIQNSKDPSNAYAILQQIANE